MLATEAVSYAAAVEACTAHLLACVTANPAGPVVAKYAGDPGVYGGQFAAMCVTQGADIGGEALHDRPSFPAGLEFAVRFIDIALKRQGSTYVSGMQEAEARTLLAQSAFLDGLDLDPHMGGSVQEIDAALAENGAFDRVGNPRLEFGNTDTVLWVRELRVRIIL